MSAAEPGGGGRLWGAAVSAMMGGRIGLPGFFSGRPRVL